MPRVGYWISEKKRQKLNFEENRSLFRNAGIELIKLDLSQPLEEQGPLDAILHKVTDILAKADDGNITAQHLIHNIQSYADCHPGCVLLDPLDKTRLLLDRSKQYQQICSLPLVMRDHRIIIPRFVELRTTDVEENKVKLAEAGVTFPLLVKPILSHGSKRAHQMAIIFDKDHLGDVEAPCVAQSFLNHNGFLYKVFVVGTRQFIVKRPSLKNLYPGNHDTIFFDTQEVSKPDSSHPLNEIDEDTIDEPLVKPDWSLLEELGSAVSQKLGMSLIGIDVIIDCCTLQYAIIDINAFPGFEGVDDIFIHIRDLILNRLQTRPTSTTSTTGTTIITHTNTTTNSSSNTSTTVSQHVPPHFPSPASENGARDRSRDRENRAAVGRETLAAANAANLKASQQQAFVDGNPSSHMIQCPLAVGTANNHSHGGSGGGCGGGGGVKCGTRAVVGKSEGGVVGEEKRKGGKVWLMRTGDNNNGINSFVVSFQPPS